jgi:hypothetical protein
MRAEILQSIRQSVQNGQFLIRRFNPASRRGVAAVRAEANRFAANVLPIIREIKRADATSLRAIAEALNARGRGGNQVCLQASLERLSGRPPG